jgi:hypothetical protein
MVAMRRPSVLRPSRTRLKLRGWATRRPSHCSRRFWVVAGANEASLQGLAPDQRKRRTLDALIAWFGADAQQTPLVILVEDLHWVDASTRDLLGTLLERIAHMPIMVVLTFRPEFVPALGAARPGLDAAAGAVDGRAERAGRPGHQWRQGVAAHIVEAVARRTDGVPLFVEELTKADDRSAGRRRPRGAIAAPRRCCRASRCRPRCAIRSPHGWTAWARRRW